MKFHYFLLFFILFIQVEPLSAQKVKGKKGETLFEDRVLFRVEKFLFFHSDITDFQDTLKSINCLSPNSLLVRAMKLDATYINRLGRLPRSSFADFSVGEKSDLLKVVKLLKLSFFVQRKGLFDLSKKYQETPNKECVKKGWKHWSNWLQIVLPSDLFIAERFTKMAQVKGDQGVKADQQQMESILFFINTLHKRVKHSFYAKE